ncbi:TetR/AcrR family transcriptional regulator [Pelagerythrobacter marensis]|uniref:TetR/AcrR family transcriptional regulator n=1 Tax=Pelagerythrobacter marensis TaxID=543877 RepID=A0ABZ2D9Y7_9SPHN
MAEKPRRQTQAERSAGTREALLSAAIETLHEHGYAATSTMLVAEKAGVSRGAMLHQFRTKADLMTFVVEAVFEEELERYAEYLSGMTDPEQRLLAYPEMAWDVLSRPSGVAVLEILQGSRSDPQLCEKLAPVQTRIEEQALAFTHLAAPGDTRGAMAVMRLIVWAVRGLSIAQVLAPAPGSVRDSVKLLRRLIEAGLETGVLSVRSGKDI